MAGKKALKITYCGLFAGLIAVCSWINVPAVVPFTLQTLGVFLCYFTLGGKCGTASVLAYLLLGAVGVPVFSSFRGGVGVLFSQTGGYLWGVLFGGIIVMLLEKFFEKTTAFKCACGVILLLATYLFGTLWYAFVYGKNTEIFEILKICVVPFVLPDLLKLFVAVNLSKKIKFVDLK